MLFPKKQLKNYLYLSNITPDYVNLKTAGQFTYMASLVDQTVKNLHATPKVHIPFLSEEDPLQKRMATHSSILAWKIPSTEEPGGLQSMGLQRVGHD